MAIDNHQVKKVPAAYPGPLTTEHCSTLSMPQLALSGLSEGWLLRECGSRHWSEVAAYFNIPPERLEDPRGNRLYSSFLAVRLCGHPLGAFFEGDRIHLHSRLTRLSRNRFLSHHHFSTHGSGPTLSVEMISALIRRERARDNTTLREGEIQLRENKEGPISSPLNSELFVLDKKIRSQRRGADGNGCTTDIAIGFGDAFRYRYRPLPQSDFNGAGLLYFANYHSIVDRAEFEWRPDPEALDWTTGHRETFFFANINPGDQVEVVLFDLRATNEVLSHRAQMFRVLDGRLMAEVSTVKRRWGS
jgi:probable biosynthetic protein (TIGR04098 family)